MNNKITQAITSLCLWASIFLGGATMAMADTKVGTFTVIRGAVDAMHEQQNSPVPAVKGSAAFLNDVIRTKRRSRARLSFTDGSVLNMGTNHMVNVKEYTFDQDKEERHVVVSVLRGSIRATVSKFAGDSVFEIETPTAVVSVRGTDFMVTVGPDGTTTVTVIEGVVTLKSGGVTVTLRQGQQSTAVKGQAPSAPVQVDEAMMELLVADTKVEEAKPGDQATGGSNQASVMASGITTAVIPSPTHLFKRVNTGSSPQDSIMLDKTASTQDPADTWSFQTPPITTTITNLQGCPAGQSWKAGAAVGGTCSVAARTTQGLCQTPLGTWTAATPAACSNAIYTTFGTCSAPNGTWNAGLAGFCTPAGPTTLITCQAAFPPGAWTPPIAGTCSDGVSATQAICQAQRGIWTTAGTAFCSDGVSPSQGVCLSNGIWTAATGAFACF